MRQQDLGRFADRQETPEIPEHRQCGKRRASLGKEPPIRAARGIRIEPFVVVHDENPILGHGDIGLERRDADRQRLGEGGNRVLRREAACAAMALQVECGGRRACDGHHGQRGAQPFHGGLAFSKGTNCRPRDDGHALRMLARPSLTTGDMVKIKAQVVSAGLGILKRFPTDLNRRDSQEVMDERVFVH